MEERGGVRGAAMAGSTRRGAQGGGHRAVGDAARLCCHIRLTLCLARGDEGCVHLRELRLRFDHITFVGCMEGPEPFHERLVHFLQLRLRFLPCIKNKRD